MSQPAKKTKTRAEVKAQIREYEAKLNEDQKADFAKWRMMRMSRNEPIRKENSSIPSEPEPTDEFASLPPHIQKKVKKLLSQYSSDKLYNICLGLAPRIRSFVKRVWKREDKWHESWPVIASEMAVGANKILMQRIDVVTFFGVCVDREGLPSEDRMVRMTAARAECDSLLTIFAHYFTIGGSAKLAAQCTHFAADPKKELILGGLVDVVDYGRIDASRRRSRVLAATNLMQSNGWKMPERYH